MSSGITLLNAEEGWAVGSKGTILRWHSGAWDGGGTANPRLVATPRDLRLYYYGWSDPSHLAHPVRGIGCAIAPGRDLLGLRRIRI